MTRKSQYTVFVLLACMAIGAVLLTGRQASRARTTDQTQTAAALPGEQQQQKPEPLDAATVSPPAQQKPHPAPAPAFRLIETDTSAEDNPQMALIIGNDASATMVARCQAIKELGNELSAPQINVLYTLMAKKATEDPLGIDALNTVRNEAANTLGRQSQVPPHFAGNLVAMFLDRSYDPIWREYCVQYMGRAIPRLNKNDRSLVAGLLWSLTDNPQERLAGTALVALSINVGDELVPGRQLVERARAWALSGQTHPDLRLTAIQLCAEMGDKLILATARDLANNTQTPLRLRIASIAAVGQLGGNDCIPDLERFLKEGHPVVTTAANAAIKRLKI
jgi:hypothetical protein